MSSEWVSPVLLVVKNPPADAGDQTVTGSIPELGRYPLEEGMSTPSNRRGSRALGYIFERISKTSIDPIQVFQVMILFG